MYSFVKRLLDIIISIILIGPIIVVIIFSAIWIKLDDGGPIFYFASRTGQFGKPFNMYKLRTMRVNAPDIRLTDGSTYNGKDDPRVTSFGKFARKTSIDELPQIINIIKGDMTFIGPRPDSASYLSEYTNEERAILTVRPGVTGYNQAINRNSVGTKEKLKNDIYYVKHKSFSFDIKIILMTLKSLLSSRDVYRTDSESNEITKKVTGDKVNK